jgi:putative membrane protein
MNHTIYLTSITALSLGLAIGCSGTTNDVAKTNANSRLDRTATPIFGEPGVDFPAPFYIGERNSDLGRARAGNDEINQRSASTETGDDYVAFDEDDDDFELGDRDYTIGNEDTDWNKERVYGTAPGRDRVTNRSAAPRKMMNKEPVGDMYSSTTPFPADPAVNVANLADVDLIYRFHLSNMQQVELGRMAQERGNSEWVRSLGRRIAMDNQYADRRLMNLTRRLELSVPGEPASEARDFDHLETASLDNMTGNEFDRELVRRIISAEDEKLQMLRGAEQSMPKDSRLRELVVKFIPITEQHGHVAQNVSNKYLEQNI